MKTLKELLKYLEVKEIVNANGIVIEGIAYDSRKVKKIFFLSVSREPMQTDMIL